MTDPSGAAFQRYDIDPAYFNAFAGQLGIAARTRTLVFPPAFY